MKEFILDNKKTIGIATIVIMAILVITIVVNWQLNKLKLEGVEKIKYNEVNEFVKDKDIYVVLLQKSLLTEQQEGFILSQIEEYTINNLEFVYIDSKEIGGKTYENDFSNLRQPVVIKYIKGEEVHRWYGIPTLEQINESVSVHTDY